MKVRQYGYLRGRNGGNIFQIFSRLLFDLLLFFASIGWLENDVDVATNKYHFGKKDATLTIDTSDTFRYPRLERPVQCSQPGDETGYVGAWMSITLNLFRKLYYMQHFVASYTAGSKFVHHCRSPARTRSKIWVGKFKTFSKRPSTRFCWMYKRRTFLL